MKQKIQKLGILGGGQLGRMSALAAARLGISTHIYCPEAGCPASLITSYFTQADYNDENALKRFAEDVDVISYEFENIPLETIRFLQKHKPVYPDDRLLEVSQNRLAEKAFLNKIGIETAPWAACYSAEDIDRVMALWRASECIIKTARFGYDGKGQLKHRIKNDSQSSWIKLQAEEAIIEGIIDFAYEASILVARDSFGKLATYPLALNHHKDHILSETIVPANVPPGIEMEARRMAEHLATEVNLRGILALELFVTKGGKILANEIAPRTHNSGHWSMDGCNVSQFEQHVRAVCGLPVLDPVPHSAVKMINLIGDDVNDLPRYYAMNNACVHLYGKTEARPGRKMGHVNILEPLEKKQ
jgi:5-(carboxyamino)imidazole ribonucleotide synthase